MVCHNGREDTAPDIPACRESHVPGSAGLDQVIEDAIGDGFMKGALVAVGPHVHLEGLEFDVFEVRDVIDCEMGKVWLASQGAQAGEFRDLDVNVIVPSGLGIVKGLEFFGRLTRHTNP